MQISMMVRTRTMDATRHWRTKWTALCLLTLSVLALAPRTAQALPVFARQTGQNCVACHTGGQYPELTPYGRYFKMTGYTIGERTIPLSVMGVVSAAGVANTGKSDSADAGIPTSNSNSDFYQNNQPVLATLSLFLAGKVSDRVGAFVQVTNDPSASPNADGSVSGHTAMDTVDVRYADHLIDAKQDLIFGFSLNNNPSISDPWNTAASWMQYVPVSSATSHQFADANAPYPSFGLPSQVAGVTAYAYWNRTLYGEVGVYGTATDAFRILREGTPDTDIGHLWGYAPYWRFAYTTDFGAGNLMVGTTGMLANVYDGSNDITDPNSYSQVRSNGVDAQYQYILDPHTFTAQLAYMQQTTNYSPNSLAGGSPFNMADGVTPVAAYSASDTTNTIRLKLAYTYRATYGGSLSFFDLSGTTSTNQQSNGYIGNTISVPGGGPRINGNFTGNPATSGATYELFYIPAQNVRLGVQYTAYDKYNGSSSNYDGFGRNASDNNTVLLYAWLAF